MKLFNAGRRALWLLAVALLSLAASQSDAQTLKQKAAAEGKITIGVFGLKPVGYKDENGDIAGVYVEILKAIVAPLGVTKVDFLVMEFGALIPSLQARRIDVVAGGMYITPARCKQVLFSNPITNDTNGAVVKKGNPLNIHSYEDLAKNSRVRVGDVRGASTNADLINAGVPKDRLQLFQDTGTALAALLSDRVDVLIFSAGTQADIFKDPNIKGLEGAAPFVGPIVNGREKVGGAVAFAFRTEDAEFRDLFNKGLAQRIADGTYQKIVEKYSSADFKLWLPQKGLTAKDICGENYQ